jgi:ATP-binding cassette, subfamily C, bacterial LapB
MTAMALEGRFAVNRGEPLAAALRGGRLGALQATSPYTATLLALLSALGWRGDPRAIIEALPHFAEDLNTLDTRNVLATLGFVTRPLVTRLDRIDARLMPCLFITDRDEPMVALRRSLDGFIVFDGATRAERTIRDGMPRGTAYVVVPAAEANDDNADETFLMRLAARFRRHVGIALGFSLAIDLVALAVPLAIMAIYDVVIGSRTPELAVSIGIGIAAVLGVDFALRAIRGEFVAWLGARFERLVGGALFARLLALPPAYTESAAIGPQVARLREFEGAREFFTGRLASVVLELPFAVIYLAAMAALGGSLVLVPLGLILVFLLVGAVLFPPLRARVAEASRTRAHRHAFLVEMLANVRSIKQLGAETLWRNRHRRRVAEAATAQYRAQTLSVVLMTVSQSLVFATGALVLLLGAGRAIDGELSVGALVAVLALTWRVLTPLQSAFVTLSRLEQVRQSVGQIGALMRLKPESNRAPSEAVVRRVIGGIVQFNRVSLRYRNDAEPALLGFQLEVKPGELVAVTGTNGSGKSTVLKLLAGMAQPQAGSIMVDGVDIRQLDPRELRLGISYLPQTAQLFHGTVEQNLRLAEPVASDEALERAAADAGVLDDIRALPEGFNTRLNDQRLRNMPGGFRQRLALARAYLRDCPILLLDEPATGLDEVGDAVLMRTLGALRGRRTTLIVTHRPSHMRLCDRVVVMDAGRVVMDGPANEVVKRLFGGPA